MASSLTQTAAPRLVYPQPDPSRCAARARVALILCAIWSACSARAEDGCASPSAELTVTEGIVEVQRGGQSGWQIATSGSHLCFGDAVRTQGSSRATITLLDNSTLRIDERTTLTLPEPPNRIGSLIQLIRGVIHVISRDPRQLRFTTPYANAGLEGTEFDIRVDEGKSQTEIVVLEGQVAVSTPTGQLSVPSGQLAVARAGEPPTAEPLAEPIDLMRWAGHYPRILAGPLPAPEAAAPPNADAEFFARRAAARLTTARLADATADLEAALRLAPEQRTALALEAIMALARADRDAARRLARAATQEPAPAAAWLALSYVQGMVDRSGSADSVARALALEPNNALALARLAEMALANGDAQASVEHAERAASLAPDLAEPLIVLGFAHLTRLDAPSARAAFDRAVGIDPAAPLAWLGRGLAAIQIGELDTGRRQIEMAVVLDPTNALARSYVAKVYEVENRAKLTGSQLDLAKRFDPFDPTPWVYAALQKLRANRPVEAFRDLHTATIKNGDRAALRSWLPLDPDLATRSGGIARVDTELGFARLALSDAWQAVTDRPSDYAGHRMLADAYASEPREEIARVSELFVAQLLQPANLTPIPPQLAQPASFVTGRLGPSPASFNELGSPLTQNGLRLRLSGAAGGDGLAGSEVTLAGLHDQVSYSVGGYHFATDGFRPNNDLDQRIGDAFVQFRPALDTSLQVELRSVRATHGDLAMSFDPELYGPLLRAHEAADSLRLGARHDLGEHDTLLGSLTYQDSDGDVTIGPTLALTEKHRGYGVDLQAIHEVGPLRIQAGFAHARHRESSEAATVFPGAPGPSVLTADNELEQTGLYAYAYVDALPSLTITAGAAWDRIHDVFLTEQAVNPKLGVTWRPTARTTVRAAAFRALFSSLTTSRQDPQPRLEPVQVAGFGQLLFGGTADRSTVGGVAVDHEVSQRLFVGWEAMRRSTERGAVYPFSPPDMQVQTVDLKERSQRAYLYWTPTDRLGLGATLEHGRYANAPVDPSPPFGYSSLTIERLPIELRYFSPTGLMLGFRTSRIKDHGMFSSSTLPPNEVEPGQDRFWLVDAFVGYRLPNRRGLLSLNADNLLDRRFRFQDVDPEDSSLIPERLLSFRFTLAFD